MNLMNEVGTETKKKHFKLIVIYFIFDILLLHMTYQILFIKIIVIFVCILLFSTTVLLALCIKISIPYTKTIITVINTKCDKHYSIYEE